MSGYLIHTDQEFIDHNGQYVKLDELKTTYSIPTAFQIYTKYLLGIQK